MSTSLQNNTEISPNDYDFEKLDIIGLYGTVDITYLVIELNIVESLFNKCITGSMTLQDSLNIISNLPLMEGDRLKGTVARNTQDPYIHIYDPDFSMDFEFEIVKIQEQKKVKQDVQIWKVSFVSCTWSDNLAGRVSKSYRQKQYSDMVLDIFNTHLKKGGLSGALPSKALAITATEKLWNIVIPNMKPYHAITFLMRRSFLSLKANYLFYETKDSFYFKPMDILMDAGPVATYYQPTVSTWTEQGEGSEPSDAVLEAQYNALLSVSMAGYHDVSTAAAAGMISHRLIKHDLYNKRITDYHVEGPAGNNYIIDEPYDYFEQFGLLSHCEGGNELITATTNSKFVNSGGDGILGVYPEHKWQWDDQESFEPEKWTRQRKGHMETYKFIKLQAITPGNLTRKVGDKIEIEFISPQWKVKGSSEKKELDKKFQGNYIISSLRRKFTDKAYVNVIELIKDDYVELTNDPIWEDASSPLDFIKYDGHGKVIGL